MPTRDVSISTPGIRPAGTIWRCNCCSWSGCRKGPGTTKSSSVAGSNNATAFSNLAGAYLALGNAEKSLATTQRLLEAKPRKRRRASRRGVRAHRVGQIRGCAAGVDQSGAARSDGSDHPDRARRRADSPARTGPRLVKRPRRCRRAPTKRDAGRERFSRARSPRSRDAAAKR